MMHGLGFFPLSSYPFWKNPLSFLKPGHAGIWLVEKAWLAGVYMKLTVVVDRKPYTSYEIGVGVVENKISCTIAIFALLHSVCIAF